VNPQYSAIAIFVAAFFVSGLSGIASLLRSGKEVKKITIITASLNSGLLGLAISLLWYQKFQENIYELMGICVMSGLGGAASLDFILNFLQKGYFASVEKNNKDKDPGPTKEVQQ